MHDTDTDTDEATTGRTSLDNIAAEGDGMEAAQAHAVSAPAASAEPAPSLPPEIIAGMKLIPLACLRMLRARIARSTPEILNHWTDDVIDGPASTFPPLLMRYAERWAPVLGSNPEITMFALSCVPLGMGYIAAGRENEAKQAKTSGDGLDGAQAAPSGIGLAHAHAEA